MNLTTPSSGRTSARSPRPERAAGAEALDADPAAVNGAAGEAAGPSPGVRWVQPRTVLRWVYLARLGLAGGVFGAAALSWSRAAPVHTLLASLILVSTLVVAPASYWLSHVRRRGAPQAGFLYAQAAYDVLLVTTIVHLTGGSDSVVAPTYILLISAYTLMLPLRGGFLVAGLSSIAYVADVVWGQQTPVNTVVALQLTIFVAVALAVGLIGTKLREKVTQLSSMEHELEQLKLDTSDILGNLSTAVLTVDGLGRLAYANWAAAELMGVEAEDWLDRPFMEELQRVAPDLYRIIERTRRYRVAVASAEISILREAGSVPVGVSTTVLERRIGAPSVTAIMRDISDRKRIQELRNRTQRLEAVAELSASLAHEIKNPLSSIRSSVEQLRLGDAEDDDDRVLSRLILRESDRLSRLLSEFIDFARVRIARSDPVDLRRVARHAVEVVRQHPEFRDEVEIVEKLPDEPVVIEGDEDLLHRVVSNLVLNAVQAAPPGRRTTVEVEVSDDRSRSPVRGLDVTSPVLVRVSDDGPGIPETDLSRIFDPFFSGRRGGTGLGLAIVHRAVEAHRGSIFVESEPGEGTRFSIYLPATPPPRDELQREA